MGREKLNRHVWLHTLAILILQDLNKKDCHEFKANLGYGVPVQPELHRETISREN